MIARSAQRASRGRKLRAALTALAIVLGVAMISGTYILTDTIKSAFGTVFTQVYKHTDVVITGKSAIGGGKERGGANDGALAPRIAAWQSARAPRRGADAKAASRTPRSWWGATAR